MTFKNFQITKLRLTPQEFEAKARIDMADGHEDDMILSYHKWYYIVENKDDNDQPIYMLILCRDEYISTNLLELEQRLYEWVATQEEWRDEDYLHQRARDIMAKLDKKYNREPINISLDEYIYEYNHTYREMKEATTILKLFYI